ncbi:transglutaminase family protein [Tessaracoccus sp. ZS01]|uniref:transglutaminase-like domain-containing protein n=1 Tax=Tessaracoccus sp. ZS01 TaxID=1906324 RepID=UPI00117DF3AB|nr:transglutaminase-like domain-containing protein [Tessaracoccus sp. ZS01]
MRFTHHPFSHVIVAAAVWLSMLPLSTLVSDTQQVWAHAWFILGAAGTVGLVMGLLRAPRALVLFVQLLVILGVLAWRGLALAPRGDPLASLRALTADGVEVIRTGVPPLEPEPGLVWLCLILAALLVIIVELLVNGLEQPAWTIAPLALTYGVAALVRIDDLDWLLLVPVVAGFIAILLSSTGAGEAAGKASRASSHHLSRVSVGWAFGAAALVVAILVSAMVPLGDKRPWTEGGQDGPIQLSDPTVRLDQDLRRPTDSPVLTYRTSTGGPVYMRTVALPNLSSSGAGLVPMSLSRSGLDGDHDFPGEQVTVDVQMDAVPSEYLPAPFAAASYDADGAWSHDPDTLAIVASGPNRTQQTVNLGYRVESTLPSPTREEVSQANPGSLPSAVTREVPAGLSPGVTALTSDVVAGATTAGEKALAIQRFLRSDAFRYTLEAPNTAGTDTISSFLLEARSGYCIHFAAAMITMARIEGIDARMAVGFVPGEQQADGSYLVTSHDAHSWPELYFEGLGWVPFEPTPAYQGDPEYVDPSAMQPATSPSPSPTPSAAPTPQPTTVPPTMQPVPTAPTTVDDGPGPVVRGLLIALLVLLALALPALVRLGLRASRLRSDGDPGQATDRAWREVQAMFADYGLRWPEGSPGPVGREAAEQLSPRGAEALAAIAATVERSRYSRDGAPVAELPAEVGTLREALAGQATRGARLRAVLLPASLWRLGR